MNKAFMRILFIAFLTSMSLVQAQTNGGLQEKFFPPERLELVNKIQPGPNKYEEYMRIALEFKSKGKFDTAVYLYQSLLQLPHISKEQKLVVYGSLSTTFGTTGDYNAAIEAYLKAIQLSDQEDFVALLKLNASSLYMALLDYDEAFKMIDESLFVFKKRQDVLKIAMALGTKGGLYKTIKEYPKAIVIMQEAYSYLADKKRQQYKDMIKARNMLLNNIGDTYLQLLMPDSVIYYLEKTKPEFDLLPQYQQAIIYITYGEAHTLLHHHALALQYFQKGLAIAEKANMHSERETAYKGLSMLYAQQGDYQKAWAYERKYVALYTQKLSEDNRNKISQLQARYLLEKKDKEMAKKELLYNKNQRNMQQRNNRLYLLMVIIGLSTVTITVFFRNYYNKSRFLNLQLKNAANENLINQIDATLKGEENERERIAQELHDSVVSELMSLRLNLKDIKHNYPELQLSEQYNNVLYQSEEAADKLRRTAHNMMPAKLKEQGLAKTIEAFINRLSSHKLHISFLCYGHNVKLKDNTEKILLATTQELVQNVVKHAKASEALVQLNYYEDTLGLTVEDNGVGINNAHQNSTGMGWNNIRRNVAVIGGSIDVKSSEQKGTTILIELKLDS